MIKSVLSQIDTREPAIVAESIPTGRPLLCILSYEKISCILLIDNKVDQVLIPQHFHIRNGETMISFWRKHLINTLNRDIAAECLVLFHYSDLADEKHACFSQG
jgi:hypothetical protein